jgi:hypothetical protein
MSFAFFENRQIFESLDNLILRVNEHSRFEEYVVVLLRIKKFKLEVRKKTWLICDRERKVRESQDQDRRHISNKYVACSFSLIAKRKHDDENTSCLLKMKNSNYNHSFNLADAHSILRKMTMTFEVKNEIFRQLIV